MSGLAAAMMVAICSFVWGGFVLLLGRALRSESRKAEGR